MRTSTSSMWVCGFGMETVNDIWGAAACDFSGWAFVAAMEAAIRIVSVANLKAEEYFWFIIVCPWKTALWGRIVNSECYYELAIISVLQGKKKDAKDNLLEAIGWDSSLREKAQNDSLLKAIARKIPS